MRAETPDNTTLTGLLGWPVEHSLSPAMHNAAFEALSLDWEYLLLPTPPEDLAQATRRLCSEGFGGANVTVPHKEAVIDYLDRVSSAAQAIGAVNTIRVEGSSLVGANTDWAGFLRPLWEEGFDPAGARCGVIGAGGAARAVVYALATAGADVVVCNRTEGRAERLVGELDPLFPHVQLEARPLTSLAQLGSGVSLLVNATSVGMVPDVDASPWPDREPLPTHLTLYDLVYNPRETRFLRQARRVGARTIGGLGMLVHQGAEAFELWTGRSAPIDVMREAALQELEGDS